MDQYEYAGANLGGQMLSTCGRCGSLLQESGQGLHDFHHTAIDAGLRLMADAAKKGEGTDETVKADTDPAQQPGT